MPSSYNNRRSDGVRVIDHEPLTPEQQDRAAGGGRTGSVFGKRKPSMPSSRTGTAGSEKPYEQNGISTYFINRVRENRVQQAVAEKNSPSAIRGPDTLASGKRQSRFFDEPEGKTEVPYSALAAVFALAFAIPMGFIWLTEQASGPGIDTMTTASVSAAEGLAVRDVSMTRILKNGTFVVTVSGRVSNTANERKSLLPLTISLIDENGVEVQSWRHRAGTGVVKPDGSLFFNTSAIDFSGRARTAHVTARTIP